MWAGPTLVITPTCASTWRASGSIMPISNTPYQASRGRRARLIGTPTWLLKEAVLADVGAWACSMARSASLVLVLPTEPVTLATFARLRARPAWPRSTRAFIVSSTLMMLPAAPGTSRDTIAAAAPRAMASAT